MLLLLNKSFYHRVELPSVNAVVRPSGNVVTGPTPLGGTLVAAFDRMEGDRECGMLSNMLEVLSDI